MRMRFKSYARPELAAWPYHVDDPAALRGRWHSAYADPNAPLRLELGCGKGGFIAALALRKSGCNFLGIDIKSEVLVVAKRNIEAAYAQAGRKPENVRITSKNIEQIADILSPEDKIERLYINFCNPWHKSGHPKHRLTHPRQLVRYREFLCNDAEIHFKTDDDILYNATLRYLPLCGFDILWQTRDLHHNEPAGNIRTEHENMFAAEGIPIKACVAVKRPANLDVAALLRLKDI